MRDDQTIICALYGDEQYRQSILRELGHSKIEAYAVSSGELSESEVPAWVSNRGAGATHYILVPVTQKQESAAVLQKLNRICQACGAYFSDELLRCPTCNAEWAARPAE